MTVKPYLNGALMAGASAMALMLATPAALAQAADDDASTRTLGTVTVTTQKKEESIQDVPIAVSAFDQAAIEAQQLTGGPDLVKAIPNVNFTKGNFGGFNFRIRGIGVDAVSTSADAGVGIHYNDAPIGSNSFFEAEFYDVERVETLRGPQGTLYGRNATGGVVNVISAKPVLGEYQADLQFTLGNHNSVKARGMMNIPLGDKAALRLAGSSLSRDGYVDNLTTGNKIDSRDLYAFRGTLAFEPTDRLRTRLMVEIFNEDDSRLRSGKQLCAKDPTKTSFAGIPILGLDQAITSQGCVDGSLYLPGAYQGSNTASSLGVGLGILSGLIGNIDPLTGNAVDIDLNQDGIVQDFRAIESVFDPTFNTEQTLFMWNAEYDLTDDLQLTYNGSYNERKNTSQQDYSQSAVDIPLNTTPSPFLTGLNPDGLGPLFPVVWPALFAGGVINDPQLGPQSNFYATDLSGSDSQNSTHELRLQSDFDGPFNFNLGLIKVDGETNQGPAVNESYYVFFNTASAYIQLFNAAAAALPPELGGPLPPVFSIADPANAGATPLDNLEGTGRNYFRSITPYKLDSFAVFGEGYFDVTDELKVTAGLRYTSDKKEVGNIPTFLLTADAARPDPLAYVANAGASNDDGGDGTLNRTFEEVTGRLGFDWSPDLAMTEDSLFYAFYSRGYKGGGINPPQPADNSTGVPQAFDPEFIDSYEIGTKNTLAGGRMQLNATGFIYDYTGYQISAIVNRTSANFNVDAEISGIELETVWNPASTLLINANLGLLDAKVVDTFGVDILDRTNGRADLVVLKNFGNFSNCVVSAAGYATVLGAIQAGVLDPGSTLGLCAGAFAGQEAAFGLDGVTVNYTDSLGQAQTATALQPFDGDAKNLDGNRLPGTPETTFNVGAEYTWEGVNDSSWDLRLRGDYYYQGDSFSRVWNTARDTLESWDNINLSVQMANMDNGVTVELFGKNLADKEVITGAYLTDDSSGLFTNVFLTEPQTYGVSIRKSW